MVSFARYSGARTRVGLQRALIGLQSFLVSPLSGFLESPPPQVNHLFCTHVLAQTQEHLQSDSPC